MECTKCGYRKFQTERCPVCKTLTMQEKSDKEEAYKQAVEVAREEIKDLQHLIRARVCQECEHWNNYINPCRYNECGIYCDLKKADKALRKIASLREGE